MKKGYGLIEVLVTLCIVSILLVIEINMLSKESLRYKRNILDDRAECYCTNALTFIENEIKDISNKNILVENNRIILRKQNGDIYTIKPTGDAGKYNIVIIYDKVQNDRTSCNIIVENLKNIEIMKNKNVIFIDIESLKGKKFYKCVGLEEKMEDS